MHSPHPLYFDADGTRYFVIPEPGAVPTGSLELLNLDGAVLNVDPEAARGFEADEATVDALMSQHAASMLQGVTAQLTEKLKPLKALAPGLEALLTSPAKTDGAEALATLVGLEPGAVRSDPSALLGRLDALVDGLGGPVAEAPSSTLDEVVARLERLAGRGREVLGPLGAALLKALDGAPAAAEVAKAEAQAAARASVEAAFKDRPLPSFRFEDLIKPPSVYAAEIGAPDPTQPPPSE